MLYINPRKERLKKWLAQLDECVLKLNMHGNKEGSLLIGLLKYCGNDKVEGIADDTGT